MKLSGVGWFYSGGRPDSGGGWKGLQKGVGDVAGLEVDDTMVEGGKGGGAGVGG